MGKKAAYRIPKMSITVKEDPLDTEAKKYIAMFSEKVAAEKKKKSQKSKGHADAAV